MTLNFATEAAAIRSDKHVKKFDELWRLCGSYTASIKRLISSTSGSVGVPPTNLYASGLTDLRAIPGSLFTASPRREDTPYPTDVLRSMEFFNIELTKSDIVTFAGRDYNVIETALDGGVVKAYEISGETFTLSGDGPPAPSCLACGLSVKPSSSITFALAYVDADGVSRTSADIVFGADCKLEDYESVVTASGVQHSITSVTAVVDAAGTIGSGLLYLSAQLPFQSHVLLAETS